MAKEKIYSPEQIKQQGICLVALGMLYFNVGLSDLDKDLMSIKKYNVIKLER